MEAEMKQDPADLHAEHGITLYKEGKIEAARKEWQTALELDPQYVDAHYNLAKSYQDEKQFDLAEAEFRAILQVDPDDSDAHLGLASIADERDDWENSIREYREVLRLEPDDDETRRNLVWDLIQHGDLADAQTELGKISQDSPKDDAPLWVLLGEAFEKQGDNYHAIEAYKEVLEINPDLREAREKLKQLAPNGVTDLPPTTLRFVMVRMGIIFTVLICVALGVLTWLNAASVLPKFGYVFNLLERRVVLQFDQSLSESDLNASATIISQRLSTNGMSPRLISISPPNRIIMRMPGYFQVSPRIFEGFGEEHLLEFVDTGDTSIAAGTLIKTTESVLADGSDGVYHTVMTGKEIRSASVAFNSTTNQPYIAFQLTDEGRQIFATYTAKNVGKYLTIALNKKVLSSPVIKSAITGGSGIIEGQFTLAEAQALVLQLNTKQLPANFKIISDELVFAFLGD